MNIESDHLRVVLGKYGFHVQTYHAGEWQDTTTAVSSAFGGLTPSEQTQTGYRGAGDGFEWESHFSPKYSGILIQTRLSVRKAVKLNPSMILWLHQLDDMEDRQAHTWRQTILRAPSLNATGLGGNDLPACYLYDHAGHTETICYYPPDQFAWTARRFGDFQMREVFRYHPDARYGLGLTPITTEAEFEFPVGEHHFEWWFTQKKRDTIPTAWEAQTALIEALDPHLDPTPTLIDGAIPWSEMAKNTQSDLKEEACWLTVNGVKGLRAYVKGSSAVGRDHDRGFELMTQLDVLHPLLLWSHMSGHSADPLIVDRLLKTLPEFDRPLHHFVANGFPAKEDDTYMDTWYFLENALIKLPWVAHLTQNSTLQAMFLSALKGAQELAHHSNYIFPLFADAQDWKMRGGLLNPSVGGLYAAGCVLGWQITQDELWLQEASETLQTFHRLPTQSLTHEPQQLALGAAAAQYLANVDIPLKYTSKGSQIAVDLVQLSLRMGYWGRDANIDLYDPRGMFQACASLSYPAYKENVETLFTWPELLKAGQKSAFTPSLTRLMAKFINLARCHNYAFFDPYLPEALRHGPCPYIPYEDLATSEFPHSATLGKELYGAGEVFWSALMFDALGTVQNAPDTLCLSLNIPMLDLSAVQPTQQFRPEKLDFLVYNPTSQGKSITVTTSIGSSSTWIDVFDYSYCSIYST